jgi:hypothetical protein
VRPVLIWRLVVLLPLLLITLAAAALHLYGDRMLIALVDGYLASQELELQRGELQIDWFAGSVSGEALTLINQADNHTIISVQHLRADLNMLELLQDDNGETLIDASEVSIFLTSDGEDPELGADWVAYRRWLPGLLDIRQLVVHWVYEREAMSFSLATLHGETGRTPGSYEVQALEDQNDNFLSAVATLQALERLEGDFYGVDLDLLLRLRYQGRASQMKFDGTLQDTADRLHYEGKASAKIEYVESLLELLELDYPLEGALDLSGDIQGDFNDFQLSELSLNLDHRPVFYFDGTGEFGYAFDGTSRLDIVVNTELDDLENLMDVIEADLSGFSSVKASLRLQGKLDDILVTDIDLKVDNASGLELDLAGDIRINAYGTDHLLTDKGLSVTVNAPELATLERWTGDVGFETGPWQASGKLQQSQGRFYITNLKVAANDGAGLVLNGEGSIAELGSTSTDYVIALKGINLDLELNSPSSQRLTQPFWPELPELGAVSLRARLEGNDELLQFREVEVALSQKDKYHARGSGGSLDVHPGSQIPLRDLRLSLAANLLPAPGNREYMGGASGELAIASISPLQNMVLGVKLKELSVARLLQLTRSGFDYHEESGFLNGKFTLQGSGDNFRLNDIDIQSARDPQVTLALSGKINNLKDLNDINLRLEGSITDKEFLYELTGLSLNPWRGLLGISGSGGALNFVSNNHFGETELKGDLKLDYDGDKLIGLSAHITSPAVYLGDIGLSGLAASDQPEVVTTEADKGQQDQPITLPLQDLPTIPMDLRLDLQKIFGDNFDGNHLETHLVAADGLYTLRKLEAGHEGGSTLFQGSLDTRSDPPAWTLQGSVLGLPVEDLLQDLGITSGLTADFNTAIDLSAKGDNVQAIAGTLDGSVTLVLEDTTIHGAAYDLLATETVAWFFTVPTKDEKTVFTCIMAEFLFDQGRAQSDEIFIETEHMLALGRAEINFNEMTVNSEITPKSKSRTFQIPGTVKINGPFNDLKISSSALAAVGNLYSELLTLVPDIVFRIADAVTRPFAGKKKKKLNRCQQLIYPDASAQP